MRVSGGSAYQITYTLIQCADLRGPVDSACMRGVWGVGLSGGVQLDVRTQSDFRRFQFMISIDHGTASSDVISELSGSDLLSRNLRVSQPRDLQIFSLFDFNCMHDLES